VIWRAFLLISVEVLTLCLQSVFEGAHKTQFGLQLKRPAVTSGAVHA
jgi:hypothetical protein